MKNELNNYFLNTEFFIARRIFSGKDSENRFSKPIVNIAITGIALGIVVMIVSIALLSGYKKEIKDKVFGFGGHVQIANYDANYSFEAIPISKKQDFYPGIEKFDGIRHIQVFATKAGIIKTFDEIQGVIFKGVDSDYNWDFINKNIVEGSSFVVSDSVKSNQVIISKTIADLLKLEIGDDLDAFFIQDPPRMRKFEISGIYNTGMIEFDKLFVIADIKHIQKLNDWNNDMISGFEVLIDDYRDLNEMTSLVRSEAGFKFNQDGSKLKVQSVKEKYTYFFDLIALFDTNVWVIIILMTIVAGFNMISGLLIIILERTRMIGILKAVGAENRSIRRIFIYNAIMLIGKGMVWGNIAGFAICLIQKYTGMVELDPGSYYVDVVPIDINIFHMFLLNIGTLAITFGMLVIPSMIVSKITPVKAIRFN